ncbi:CAP domain-containing protein [Microbulbifer pacificus]|uniref:SCP domain-containing protein n=1 Tax=Microbulbifer pacificus TaxID=407164 RepID=A0AAU0N4P9_9GAMM|nr:hypothetical protein [Microbulbifer pacificus]WOX07249.1 hypothetical protein R5R33_08965 [Microbulbifer pacificus]
MLLTFAFPACVLGSDCAQPSDCLALELHNQVRRDLNAGRLPNSPIPTPPVAMLVYDQALARTAHNWSAA